MADEAAPPERGVQLDERPQLRLVAPHPREQNRDAPRLPRRRRRFRRPVEPPAAAGPHGLRLLLRRRCRPCSAAATVEEAEEEGNRSKGLRCFTCLFLVEMEIEMEVRRGGGGDGDGGGRFGVWFVARFYFPFREISSNAVCYFFFPEVCTGVCLCAVSRVRGNFVLLLNLSGRWSTLTCGLAGLDKHE